MHHEFLEGKVLKNQLQTRLKDNNSTAKSHMQLILCSHSTYVLEIVVLIKMGPANKNSSNILNVVNIKLHFSI